MSEWPPEKEGTTHFRNHILKYFSRQVWFLKSTVNHITVVSGGISEMEGVTPSPCLVEALAPSLECPGFRLIKGIPAVRNAFHIFMSLLLGEKIKVFPQRCMFCAPASNNRAVLRVLETSSLWSVSVPKLCSSEAQTFWNIQGPKWFFTDGIVINSHKRPIPQNWLLFRERKVNP